MRVSVEVDEKLLEGSNGQDVAGVEVTCTRCQHSVEVFGTTDASIKRGCVMLREECPNKEANFYTAMGS